MHIASIRIFSKAKKSRPNGRDFYMLLKLFLVKDIPYTNLRLEAREGADIVDE